MDARQREDLQAQEQENANLEEGETGSEEQTSDGEGTGEEEEESSEEHGSGSDSEEDEEKTFINQEAVNKAINKQHRRYRDEQRAHQETQRKLEEANKRLAELDKKEPPVVPPVPDPLDPQYSQKMQERDQAIQKLTQYNADQENAQRQVETQQAETQQQQQQSLQKDVQTYQSRIKELGLDAAKNAEAENIVVSYNLHPGVSRFLLQEPNGPLMVQHLASNLDELGDVATMDPYRAVSYLKSTVEPKALKIKPKLSSTPNPIRRVQKGKGTDPNKEFMDGVTLE